MQVFLSFFFSSRRRHTRYWRDWSSDVCSSDLEGNHAAWCRGLLERGVYPPPSQFEAWFPSLAHTDEQVDRSEERRVGKECRSRWSEDNLKEETHENGSELDTDQEPHRNAEQKK